MNDRIWEREQVYRRRFRAAIPLAAVIVATLFFPFDRASIDDIDRHIGWTGELRLMPEITIVPDNDATNVRERQRRLTTMASVDLHLTDGRGFDSPEFQNVESPEEIELLDYAESDQFRVRTEEKRRDVPYSREYVILKMVEPEYPEDALTAGIEGSVLLELFVAQSGNVEEVTVLSRFGPASFEESSLEAVRQFVFQPPIQGGRAAAMQIKFVIKFRIFS